MRVGKNSRKNSRDEKIAIFFHKKYEYTKNLIKFGVQSYCSAMLGNIIANLLNYLFYGIA